MISIRLILLLVIIVGLLATGAQAHEPTDVTVLGAWARATADDAADMTEMATEMPMASDVSAAYMQVINNGDHPVRLVSAISSAAGIVEVHETQMDGDIMRMRPVESGIDIPAGETASLEPGGYHVMLLDLFAPLVAGEAISLTLTFENLEDDGTPTGETFAKIIGALIADEAPTAGDLLITEAWARPAAAEGTSGAYMQIFNGGAAADRLVSAATDAAGLVEVHETQMDGDIMRMRPVESGIDLPAGETASLEPGGYHVMLMDLPADLIMGEAITLTLVLESGVEMQIAVPIYDAGMGGDMHMEHGNS
jgi:hypothetical protein